MKALILAAGLGTRIRPFTFFCAKAGIPLLDVPFIRYPLQYLYSRGVREAVVNLHAHPDSVRAACGTDYRGIRISYSQEPEILGTAGAMRKAAPMLGDDPFVVMNSDMLSDIPLVAVLEQHKNLNADITLVIMKDARFANYGGVYFEGSPLKLSGFRTGTGESFHYTGLQIVSPHILERIPPEQKTGIFTDIYPQLMKTCRIYGYLYDGPWKEMGNLREYLRTSVGLIHHSLPVNLQPPGMNPTLISPKATIEPGAEVIDSIVMQGACITAGSRVEHSIIGSNVTVSGNLRGTALARGILPWYF